MTLTFIQIREPLESTGTRRSNICCTWFEATDLDEFWSTFVTWWSVEFHTKFRISRISIQRKLYWGDFINKILYIGYLWTNSLWFELFQTLCDDTTKFYRTIKHDVGTWHEVFKTFTLAQCCCMVWWDNWARSFDMVWIVFIWRSLPITIRGFGGRGGLRNTETKSPVHVPASQFFLSVSLHPYPFLLSNVWVWKRRACIWKGSKGDRERWIDNLCVLVCR